MSMLVVIFRGELKWGGGGDPPPYTDKNYFLAVGGSSPFRRRYMAAIP
jgi:hypothetical protein